MLIGRVSCCGSLRQQWWSCLGSPCRHTVEGSQLLLGAIPHLLPARCLCHCAITRSPAHPGLSTLKSLWTSGVVPTWASGILSLSIAWSWACPLLNSQVKPRPGIFWLLDFLCSHMDIYKGPEIIKCGFFVFNCQRFHFMGTLSLSFPDATIKKPMVWNLMLEHIWRH